MCNWGSVHWNSCSNIGLSCSRRTITDAESIPDGIVPLEFETNDEIIAFLDSLDALISETSNIDQNEGSLRIFADSRTYSINMILTIQ